VEEQSQELDAMRIRRVAKARQTALRSASHCLIAAGACAVAVVDLLWRAARRVFVYEECLRPLLYVLAAGALAWICVRFTAKAAQLRRLAREKSLSEPLIPPDFSTLSDGSQFAKNLEQIE
jgi:hypothetical protein